METVTKPCVVCGIEVELAADFEGDALCIADYFADDPTEEWERDE